MKQEKVASGDMFDDYIEWRSKHPSDDLMTQLLNAEFEDEHGETRTLTRQEVLTYTAVIAGAGNETTGRLIGWLAKVLAEHPDQRRAVVEDRSLIPQRDRRDAAVRAHRSRHGPLSSREDIEYYGTTIPAGSPILLLLASANRDPRRYADPDVFDIHREDVQHLTFGYGLHFCLGANLARLEGRVALDELLNRFPEWDVDYDDIKLAPTSTVRGWERMPLVIACTGRCPRPSEPVVVVSNDTHIGPRLVEDLRDYCPSKYLDEFDRFAAETATEREAAAVSCSRAAATSTIRTSALPATTTPAARLADYDHDGIAAGVIFHGSMNMEPIPFVAPALGRPKPPRRPRAGRRRAVDLQPLARRLRVAGTAPTHRSRLPADVGRRRRGRRGASGRTTPDCAA